MKPATAAVLYLAALAPAGAVAMIVPTGATTTGSATVAWTYQLEWRDDFSLPAHLGAAVGLAAHPDLAQATSFTLHGFAGYVPGTCTAPVGWVCEAQSTASTAADVWNAEPIDSVDLVWAYISGPAILAQGGVAHLGEFSAQSIHGDAAAVNYTGHTFNGAGSSSGPEAYNTGITKAPAAARLAVPEPATAALAGLGVLMLMLQRRRTPREEQG